MKNIERTHNLIGQRFGRLVVIGLDDRNSKKTYWVCQCDCGGIKSARSDCLLCGAVKSCGCMKKEQDKKNLTANHSHKQSGTRLYRIWQGIKKRCNDVHDARYDRYGGRGISICDEWEQNFKNFFEWAMHNGYDETLTIDRIDNNGDYCPDNCRWSTQKEQSNNRSTTIRITIGNATKSLKEWCSIFEIEYGTIIARYHSGKYTSIDELFNGKG